MRFLFFILSLFFSLSTYVEVRAQIFMPAMRGVISSKPAIATTMYSGGIGNGSDIKSIIQSICPSLDVESIFYGGTGYSSSEKNLIQSNCTPLDVESIFYGGTGYSSSEKNLIQSNCPPLEIESIFYGGTGYSSSEKNLIQGECTPLAVESIFKGGTGYGDAYLFKDNCSPQVITNGLKVYLDASNSSSYSGSGTSWLDLSGTSNNGTLYNGASVGIGPTYSNQDNGSLLFDGSNDIVSGSVSPSFSSTYFTIDWWIKPNNVADYNQIMSLNSENSWGGFSFHTTNNGQIYAGTDYSCNCRFTPTTGVNLIANTWQNITFTYSNRVAKLYINGVEKLSQTFDNLPSNSTITKYIIGKNSATNAIDGAIGSFKLYDVALSGTDVMTNFNGAKSRFGL